VGVCAGGVGERSGRQSQRFRVDGTGYVQWVEHLLCADVGRVYQFVLTATDSCGLSDADTVVVTVTMNSAPVVTLPGDSSVFQCGASEICFGYTVGDGNGGAIVETMVSGYGTIDTSSDEICFTPSSEGTYEFIVKGTDSCGASDEDTLVVTVDMGEFAAITCPSGPIDISLCSADEVCQPLRSVHRRRRWEHR